MRRRLFCILLFLVFVVVNARSQAAEPQGSKGAEDIKAEILKHEDEDHQAFMTGDANTIDRLYADDVSLTYADGKMITKTQLLADIRSGKHKLFQVAHDDVQMHIYGDTVVVTGHSTATGKLYNNPRRFTNVYMKQADGKWRLIAHQVTFVAKE